MTCAWVSVIHRHDCGDDERDRQPDVPSWRSQGSGSPIQLAQEAGDAMANHEVGADQPEIEPRPAAVTFVTTEHFTLQGARSSTIAEATGRATMFLGAVSGGLIALGLRRLSPGSWSPSLCSAR